MAMEKGKRNWVFADGELPPKDGTEIEAHESLMILNLNDEPATVKMTILFEDRDPVENIPSLVPAKRIRCFKSHEKDVLGGLEIGVGVQYSMQIKSDVGVIVQYGRLDVQQSNMAYMALMAEGK